jgi:hypothetical protein
VRIQISPPLKIFCDITQRRNEFSMCFGRQTPFNSLKDHIAIINKGAWRFCWTLILVIVHKSVLCQDSLNSKHQPTPRDVKDFFLKTRSQPKPKALYFSWAPGAGYTLTTGFAIAVGANLAFHTSTKTDSKISSLNTSITYTQYDQTILPITANIWSRNDKWNFDVRWHFLQYPSQTWGVGGEKDPNDGYTINFSNIRAHQLALYSLTKHLFFGSGIFYDKIWNIREVSAPPDGSTSFQRHGFNKDELAVSLPIRLLFDSRLNQVNPSNGWYASLTWRDNLDALGSTTNWQSIVLDFRKYFRVSKSGNMLAFWLYSWQSTSKTPYLLLPSTGWDEYFNLGRGYIQGRFRSTNLDYVEMEYRFRLTRDGLLGGVAFANLQVYKLHLTTGPYAFAPAAGAGLRIKLNKYSGANLCVDYGIGQDGSQGFFLNLGEVF